VDSSNHNSSSPKTPLPPIPAKRYFTIGEVSELCGVKPHVLRYWETQFSMLRPKKNRAGNRMYRPDEIKLLLRIKELLYARRYTIAGAKRTLENKLANLEAGMAVSVPLSEAQARAGLERVAHM
jgi:DNA-binding transcriptional MerR regulator